MSDAAQLVDVMRRIERTRDTTKYLYYKPYPRQVEFHAAGHIRERLLMAGNQSGKSYSGAMELAYHLTGRYPDWWAGYRWDRPIRAWASGVTGESTRDNPQRLLIGEPGKWGTGSIPAAALKKVYPARGLPNSVDTALISHASGGLSQLAFKSYERGREKWQGETLDLLWFDEEPPEDIYSEGLTRTNATGGRVYTTFTPLLGMSTVVRRFLSDPSPDRHVTRMTIVDALHYDEGTRARIIASYPEYEREARVNGVPMLGSGRVYPIAESAITCTPFAIPSHWPRICGIDFGWDHPTAAVWIAWDRDNDRIYLYDAYRQRQVTPVVHAEAINARGKWVPVAWPADGLQTEKGSGAALRDLYSNYGVNLVANPAQFQDGSRSVEAGILLLNQRMQLQQFHVFAHLGDWFDEFRQYHRVEGKIAKDHDDLMDATRYAVMCLQQSALPPQERVRYTSQRAPQRSGGWESV